MSLYPADISDHWDTIQPKLQAIKERFNEDWNPDDFLTACEVGGVCHLFVNEKTDSFVILSLQVGAITHEVVLFIEVASGDGAGHLEDIKEIARFMGATAIEFYSKRKGFQRTGWDAKCTVYRRRVD